MPFCRTLLKAKIITVSLLVAAAASAQGYPDRPIRFLVGFAAGGGGDITARIVAQKLSEALGQQVIVENRPGASGNIAGEAAARAPANGYTLLFAAPPHALNGSLYRKMTYDPIKDFTGVIGFASLPLILNIHPSLPAKSVKDLVALAKSRPGELTFSSGGSGTFEHLSGELLKQVAEIDITHVPYKGSGASVTDLVSGQISMGFNSLPSVISYIKGQRLRPLANTDAKRSPVLPDVPTMAEAGFPDFEIVTWYGMVAPAGTPREVITRLNTEIARILELPDTKERLASLGAQPMGGSAEQFDAYIKSESVKFGKIVRALNLQVD
jgi:tripartite-type tricarboxylate transporter receptor subunit TctC